MWSHSREGSFCYCMLLFSVGHLELSLCITYFVVLSTGIGEQHHFDQTSVYEEISDYLVGIRNAIW